MSSTTPDTPQTPIVVRVPDFGDRFCVYQIVDLRTDSFTQIGKMYGSTPGFYLLAGSNRQGEVAARISSRVVDEHGLRRSARLPGRFR